MKIPKPFSVVEMSSGTNFTSYPSWIKTLPEGLKSAKRDAQWLNHCFAEGVRWERERVKAYPVKKARKRK